MTDSLRPTQPDETPWWKIYGPIAVVLMAVVALLAYVSVTDPQTSPAIGETTATIGPVGQPGSARPLPPGVMTFEQATADGTAESINWGDRCDVTTGKLKLPQWPQPDCFAPFTGSNSGSTAPGVTDTEIRVVIYLPQENDPLLKFVYSQIGNTDTPTMTFDTFKGFADIFNRYYEFYGRKLVLSRYDASGTVSDAAAATADAETIARDIKPFVVIGGPSLTAAFADTLAANHTMCIACAPGQPQEWYTQRSPYVWDVQKNTDQSQQTLAEYIGKRLNGRPATFAGDEKMHARTRVFGYVHVVSSESSAVLEQRFVDALRDKYSTEIAVIQTYELPTDLTASGKDVITRMKEAGVTSVIFSGDPLGPQYLTRTASEQEYHPEWILGVTTLADSTTFGRTYDQTQWAHAFGPSNLFARVPSTVAGAGYVYRWFFGTDAPAKGTVPIIAGPLQVLAGGLQGVGPKVSYELFKSVMFAAPASPATPITARVSFGKGIWPEDDYSALDDQTEIWWDPHATGTDELGREGKGMWTFVDGGKRYLPGEWPRTAPKVFDPQGAVAIYNTPPPGVVLPNYTPLR